jgi:O-antigen/teichoic acid export membrane protein
MTGHLKPTTRIALNTAATYGRTVIGVGLALFSSRWVLLGLGETDFGIFSVVGTLVVMLSFLNSVMAGSASRHFAYSLGQGDTKSLNEWFNASVSVHLLLPTMLIVVGWPVGEYLVRHVLEIPEDRRVAAVLIFRVSLVSAFVSMVSIPFVAMFSARQRLTELAVWGVLQAVLTFGLAWSLRKVTNDRLVFYSIAMVGITVIVQAIVVIRALWLFEACQIRFRTWLEVSRTRELFNFAAWTLIGNVGGLLRNQGSSLLLNLYYGPAVNAAYGIANQVSVQTAAMSGAMMSAIAPEITAREGRGQREGMLSLSKRASTVAAFLVLLLAIPFVLEANYVLELWLVTPPPYAAALSQLMMATFFVDSLAIGYMHAVNAHGRIAAYQATVGTLLVLTLPLAWLFLALRVPPFGVGIAFVIVQALCSLGRVVWVRRLFGVQVWRWIRDVVCPTFLCGAVAIVAAAIPRTSMHPCPLRLLLVVLTSVSVLSAATWIVTLSRSERVYVIGEVEKYCLRARKCSQ